MREIIKNFNIITKGQRKKLLFVFVIMTLQIFLDVMSIGSLLPIFTQITSGNTINFSNQYLEKIKLIFDIEYNIILFSIITLILFSLKNLFVYFYIKISSNFFSYLTIFHQEKIMKNYLSSPYSFFLKKNSSFFIREVLDETKQLNSNFIQPILAMILNVLTILFFVILLFNVNFIYTTFLIIFSIIFYLVFTLIFKKKILFFGEQRRIQNYKMIDNVKQMFEGFRELKIYNKQNLFLEDLKKRFNRMANITVARSLISNTPRLFLEVILVLMFLILILLNQNNTEQYLATIGIFTASAFRIMPNVLSLIRSYQRMNYSETALKNLLPVLDKKKADNKTEIEENFKFEKSLELKKIDFNHNEETPIFKDLNILIKKNSCIGIKGESGSGKSTFVDILCGFLKINSGSVFIDDKQKDIYDSKVWLNKISYIQQSIYIFDSNIFTNISLEKDEDKINKDLIEQILNQLNMFDFLDKNDAISLGELGSKISGGQAQRIGIARALYRKSEILIFDESFNSLDQKNYEQILNLINKLKKNKTIIIISHNNNDFLPCEKVYEIKNYKII